MFASLGCASDHGVFWEPVHPVLCKGGWHLSFDQSSNEPAPHKFSAVLGTAAHNLQFQPAQRHPAEVSSFMLTLKFFFLLFVFFKSQVLLLLVYCSPTKLSGVRIVYVLCRHLPKLQRLLESDDVNMRIAAGETIALLFELARDIDSVSLQLLFNFPNTRLS